jgi:anti-anti-sigma factor
VPLISATLATIIADHVGDVMVDLAMVEFMDASTMGVLAWAHRLLRVESRDLFLRSPSHRAQRVIQLCGFMHLVLAPAEWSGRSISRGSRASQ